MIQEQTAQVTLTVDVAVFRPGLLEELEILLIQRRNHPYQRYWALPGGKLDMQDSTLDHAAYREAQEETGLTLPTLQQVATFGNIDRDPRGRYVSVLYVALVDRYAGVCPGSDAVSAVWFSVSLLPAPLAFDHHVLLAAAFSTVCGR